VRNSDIWRELRVDYFSRRIQLGEDPRTRPELAGGITYPIWPGNASVSPRRNWEMLLERGTSGIPCLARCHHNPTPDKRKKMYG